VSEHDTPRSGLGRAMDILAGEHAMVRVLTAA
jgi:hypothetical protein